MGEAQVAPTYGPPLIPHLLGDPVDHLFISKMMEPSPEAAFSTLRDPARIPPW